MASTEIQIVNISNFEKIQNFLNDSAYKEVLENSENFNTRLCIERRLRMPFLDPQTGVAQNHCALFHKQKQRMPGFRCGQIYTYPSMKWRKPKRQYLLHHQSYKAYQFRETHQYHHQGETTAGISIDGSSLSASADNDSKDSHRNDEETKWYYDEMDLNHVEDFEEDFESDVDFDESYNKTRKRRTTKGNTRKSNVDIVSTPAKRGRRGRKKNDGGDRRRTTGNLNTNTPSTSSSSILPPSLSASNIINNNNNNTSIQVNNIDEPQMPILTPEHKLPSGEDSSDGHPLSTLAGTANSSATIAVGSNSNSSSSTVGSTISATGIGGNNSGIVAGVGGSSGGNNGNTNNINIIGNNSNNSGTGNNNNVNSKKLTKPRSERGKAQPSPYCDFCLGDARENKKTNLPEELVSCSDCGRSGHPTCLQFTPNMIISVKRYRWQCIECKYCSICGTSDNDDQLLFCDDCDRGYHMYCLQPPLTTPPEGSWSCKLCLDEFHSGKKKRGRPRSIYQNL